MRAPVFGDRDPSRAHWMELFFDLVFVALFASVWWSWVNLTFVVNVSPELSGRRLSVLMLIAMFAVGALALAAPEAIGDRAWLFAAGNALLRILLLAVWIRMSWANGTASRIRILAYNGATAVLWLVSIVLPAPANYVLWALAIVIEILLLTLTSGSWSSLALDRLNVEHLSERFGLLVIIVLGESVLSIVAAVSATWTLAAGLVGVLGLMITSGLAWSFFLYGVDVMRSGLERLLAAGDARTIRDTVAFLPFMLLAGVTALSGALAEAIAHPGEPLPLVLAVCLGGGISLFFLTNAIIARRFGDAWRSVLRWAVPAVVLPLLVIIVGVVIPAAAAVACATAILAFVVVSAEVSARRRATAG
ncbi:low temperature requirement protein A [Planctomonas sp. JC2975]|uniref:low temperature requirement protein A n=1 Tax=Planctomonas sp. JC2975 TaxID=2729626 RepID=UPI001475C612|nr:low temperature requirement protein A [Planctomonas sp. JC2975]NNC11604.1 low temperature requirement protein A [Planctomonas sp. JC2975]